MPPRINSEGQYSDKGTVDQDGKLVPYTAEEIERTRAYEEAGGIPSTLPVEDAPNVMRSPAADEAALGEEATDATDETPRA